MGCGNKNMEGGNWEIWNGWRQEREEIDTRMWKEGRKAKASSCVEPVVVSVGRWSSLSEWGRLLLARSHGTDPCLLLRLGRLLCFVGEQRE